jgi:hypothetical protein
MKVEYETFEKFQHNSYFIILCREMGPHASKNITKPQLDQLKPENEHMPFPSDDMYAATKEKHNRYVNTS